MARETADWPVIGHERTVHQLQLSIEHDHIFHAYLFHGPPRIGKRTLAAVFAAALLCRNPRPPCGSCAHCRRVQSGTHPDYRQLSLRSQAVALALSKRETTRLRELSIDFMREHLLHEAYLSPYEGERKIFLIEDADRLSTEAANCLLKILEEPPSYAVLLLLTDSVNMLLPTVLSRCRILRLGPLPQEQVTTALIDRWHVDHVQARRLAAMSAGRIGWAVAAASDEALLQERTAALGALGEVLGGKLHERFAWASKRADMVSRGQIESVLAELDLWSSWWRDVLLLRVGRGDLVCNVDAEGLLRETAERLAREEVALVLRQVEQVRDDLRKNANPRLALERLVIRVPSLESRVASQETGEGRLGT